MSEKKNTNQELAQTFALSNQPEAAKAWAQMFVKGEQKKGKR